MRLLRIRPLRQRLALAFLITVPVILLIRFQYHRYYHTTTTSHSPSKPQSHHQQETGGGGGSYSNNAQSTRPEGIPEGDAALTEEDLKSYPPKNPLRLQEAAPITGVSIAYFIQIGPDSVGLIPRLLRAMYDASNTYILHIDAKVSATKRSEIAKYIEGDSQLKQNVYIMHPEMVTYKGVSMVMNTLTAMTMALRVSTKWHYFINLSGSDYPLVSARNQRALLARPGVAIGRLNFITLFPRKEWRPYAFRIRFMHWDAAVAGAQHSNARLRVFRSLREDPLERYRHFTFTKAEAWMILSRPFVQFIARSGYAKRMLMAHLHTRSAPEHYFSDVLWNHPIWKKTLVPDALRTVVWIHHGRRSGQHPYILDAPSRWGDYWGFWNDVKGATSLFARKFSRANAPLMLRIDRHLSGYGFNNSDNADGLERRAFYRRLCTHFDEITKQTLKQQKVEWPASAYPPPTFDAT